MGRGNARVNNQYEGLYYIDYDFFKEESEGFNDFLFQDDIELIKSRITAKFKSFYFADSWDKNNHYILENSLFYVALEDNEWSIAIKLLQKDEDYYFDNINNLQKRHYQNYLNGIKDILLQMYPQIGIYGGPWTSGLISREIVA